MGKPVKVEQSRVFFSVNSQVYVSEIRKLRSFLTNFSNVVGQASRCFRRWEAIFAKVLFSFLDSIWYRLLFLVMRFQSNRRFEARWSGNSRRNVRKKQKENVDTESKDFLLNFPPIFDNNIVLKLHPDFPLDLPRNF